MAKVTVIGGASYAPGREPPGWQAPEPEDPGIAVTPADTGAPEGLTVPPRRMPPPRTVPPAG